MVSSRKFAETYWPVAPSSKGRRDESSGRERDAHRSRSPPGKKQTDCLRRWIEPGGNAGGVRLGWPASAGTGMVGMRTKRTFEGRPLIVISPIGIIMKISNFRTASLDKRKNDFTLT